MWKHLFAYTIFIATCASCTHRSDLGNFSTFTPSPIQRDIASQVADSIRASNPPAQTIVHFLHSTRDPFGRQLTQELTRAGYGVVDHRSSKTDSEVPIAYIVDEIEPKVLRVSLIFGSTMRSQVFLVDEDLRIESGPWTQTYRRHQAR